MAFKTSTSRAPAAPSMYKIGTDKFFGIDTSASDDNIRLSRACGISYYNSECSGGQAEPGLVNFIRTNIGEIGKRSGTKPAQINYAQYDNNIIEVQKCLYAADHLIVGSIDNNNTPALHIYTYDNNIFSEKVIEIGGAGEDKNWRLFHASDNNFFAGCDGGVILGKLNAFPQSLRYITPYGICTLNTHNDDWFYFDYDSKNNSYANILNSGMKIPTVFIGKTPIGGGTGYQPLNMFTGWVCEQYLSDGTATEYQLSFEADTTEPPMVYVRSSDGEWQSVKTDFAENNKISFDEAPPVPAVSGEDNVKVYYCRASGTDVLKLSRCTVCCNYGVGGYKDRLFLSGNETLPNYVWFSAMDDYTYFPETSYMTFGDEKTKVSMLAGQDSSLAVFTREKCYLVSGNVNTDTSSPFSPDALFTVSHIFESPEPANGAVPVVFNNEIVYVSISGLAAVTPSNVLDERYAQIRSDRSGYWLLKEPLSDSKLCICNDFLFLLPKHKSYSHSNKLYVFDGLQFESSQSKPFSYRQYESFIWQSIAFKAQYIWSKEGNVYLFENGYIHYIPIANDNVNEYYSDEFDIDGQMYSKPILAAFETPNIYGSSFYSKKSFSKLGILLRKSLNPNDNKEINTSVRVLYKKNNEPWKLLKDYSGEQSIFRYDYVNYKLFSFTPRAKTYDMQKKIKVKKAQCLKLRFENDIPDMPLYLQAFGLEYTF